MDETVVIDGKKISQHVEIEGVYFHETNEHDELLSVEIDGDITITRDHHTISINFYSEGCKTLEEALAQVNEGIPTTVRKEDLKFDGVSMMSDAERARMK